MKYICFMFLKCQCRLQFNTILSYCFEYPTQNTDSGNLKLTGICIWAPQPPPVMDTILYTGNPNWVLALILTSLLLEF